MRTRLLWVLVCAGIVLLAVSAAAQMAPTMQTEVGPSPSLQSMSVAELESRGDVLRARFNYAEALACYRTALRKDKKNAVLYNKAGIAELQLKQMKAAQKDFERALKHRRDYAEAYNNLGVVFYMEKAYLRAVERYRKAIELDPAKAVYHSNLGSAYFSQHLIEKAVEEFSRAVDLDPDILMRPARGAGESARLATADERAHYFFILAKMYGARGDIDKCLQCLEKAKDGNYPALKDVYKDKEFEAVRKDPRLQELMAKPQAN